jgi:hypothetical protein
MEPHTRVLFFLAVFATVIGLYAVAGYLGSKAGLKRRLREDPPDEEGSPLKAE